MADIKLTPVNLTAKLSNEGELAGKIDNALIYGGYTEEEVDELLAGKADKNHNHDSAYVNIMAHSVLTAQVNKHSGQISTLETELENHKHDEYLTEHQDISGKADITYVDEQDKKLENQLSILRTLVNQHTDKINNKADKDHTHDEYATESFVTDKIAEAELGGGSGGTVDLSGYVTEEELEEKKYATESYVGTYGSMTFSRLGHTHDQYLTEHQSLDHLALKEHTHEQYLTEHQDISHLALKTDIPSLDGLASETFVQEQIESIPEPDLSNYAFKDHTHSEYLTKHQSLDHLALKSDIPSLDGYATETFVTNKIAEAELGGEEVDLSGYATKDDLNKKADLDHTHPEYLTEHQSLDHLALKEHTHEEYLTEHQSLDHLALKDHTHEEYLTEHQDISHLALKTDIPSLDGYALKSELPSIEGLASQEYVDNANSEIQTQIDDLKSSVSNGKSLLASAITDMGVETLATDSWEIMANNIRLIQNGGGENPEDPDNPDVPVDPEEPDNLYYVEYTIEPRNDTDVIYSSYYTTQFYVPGILYTGTVNNQYVYNSYDDVLITLKDGTTSKDLSKTLACDVEKIRLYYREDTKSMRFCTNIKTLDYLNVSNFTNLSNMFSSCTTLTSVNMSNWANENIISAKNMFYGCNSLVSVDFSLSNLKLDSLTSIFNGCSSLTSVNLSNLDTAKVTALGNMFQDCSLLTSVELTKLDLSNVTSTSYMFEGCSSLVSVDLSNLNNSITTLDNMFQDCTSLTSVNISNLDTTKVTSMVSMFNGCSSLTTIDLSNFNVSNTKVNMKYLFKNCKALRTINLSNFNMSNTSIGADNTSGMLNGVPADVDWCYDGTNYTKWYASETATSFAGTFPWNETEE